MASVVIQVFNDAEIAATARLRGARVDGESFVVDWSESTFSRPKRAFEEVTGALRCLLGSEFVPLRNHHTAIVSKRLDPIDRAKGSIPPVWSDPEFSSCRQLFRSKLGDCVLELQSCVVASGGTVQLVYRNETRLPEIRRCLIDLGAEPKPGTLDDDRMNTCTVVLGHLLGAPKRDPGDRDVASLIAPAPRSIAVTRASLVRYRDTAFNDYERLVSFSGPDADDAASNA